MSGPCRTGRDRIHADASFRKEPGKRARKILDKAFRHSIKEKMPLALSAFTEAVMMMKSPAGMCGTVAFVIQNMAEKFVAMMWPKKRVTSSRKTAEVLLRSAVRS